MGTKRFHNLLRADGLSVGLWRCDLQNLSDGPENHTEVPTLNIPIQGSFVRRGPTGRELVDPLTCSFSAEGDVWCTRHLAPCRDTGIYVVIAPWRLDQPFQTSFRRMTPDDWLEWRLLVASLPHEPVDDGVDAAMRLVERQLETRPSPRCDELARDARAVLARGEARSVAAVADTLGVSVYTLCRSFRRSTGTTVHAWLDALRAMRAADAIAAGHGDLASLALDLGFSHHSHLTARVRAVFGRTPTALRARI